MYLRMKYVEMLEFIGRYAEHRFKDTCNEVKPLSRKIEMTIDSIFRVYELERVSIGKH
jgi:hypothetical protein